MHERLNLTLFLPNLCLVCVCVCVCLCLCVCVCVCQHIEMLQGEGRGARVAVGTVNRVLKLLDAGALTLERTRFVVIDMEMTVKRLLIFNMYVGDLWRGG
jgi:hypothetical protein